MHNLPIKYYVRANNHATLAAAVAAATGVTAAHTGRVATLTPDKDVGRAAECSKASIVEMLLARFANANDATSLALLLTVPDFTCNEPRLDICSIVATPATV